MPRLQLPCLQEMKAEVSEQPPNSALRVKPRVVAIGERVILLVLIKLLDNRLTKKMLEIDTAYAYTRHITTVKTSTFAKQQAGPGENGMHNAR